MLARVPPADDVAFPPAVGRIVHRQRQRAEARRLDAPNQALGPRVVAAEIQLVDERAAGGRAHLLGRRRAHRRQPVDRAHAPGCAGHCQVPVRMHLIQRAHRRRHDRQRQRQPQERRRRVDLAHVAQHPRPEHIVAHRPPVVPQRGLAIRAARHVVPHVRRQVRPRRPPQLRQRHELCGHCHRPAPLRGSRLSPWGFRGGQFESPGSSELGRGAIGRANWEHRGRGATSGVGRPRCRRASGAPAAGPG